MPHHWVQDALTEATKSPTTMTPTPSFHHEGMEMVSVRELDAALEAADCVMITTDHSAYDWGEIARMASLIVDTRRVIKANIENQIKKELS